jgi:hypothetical protein
MTKTVIKKLGVFDKTTRKHAYTIVFEKVEMFTRYVHCNETGNIVDLRKSQSFASFLPKDKLRPVKEYYEILTNKSKSFDDKCYVDINPRLADEIEWAIMEPIIQKFLSSKVVFITDIDRDNFYERQAPIENWMHKNLWIYAGYTPWGFITEDLLGEDIPIPDKFIEQAKARKDKERKKQSRIKLFETFVLPGVIDIEGFHYNTYAQKFCIDEGDIHRLIKKHIKEVVIPKFEEAGAHINIDDFKVGAFMYCKYELPLEKVKLDNIDDAE